MANKEFRPYIDRHNRINLGIFFKLYWIRIVLAVIALFLLISFVCIIVVGAKSFYSMEPFYKKMTMSQIAFSLFMSIYHVLFFVAMMTASHHFLYSGGLAKLSRKRVKPTKVNVRWSDVIGMDEIKKEVWEVINLIKDRTRLHKIGGKIIKGVLMVGPPGCGKTYMAKAMATETGLPFLYAASSEFVGMFVGLGANKIKSLFKQARHLSELHGGCIIFIDEIDSIAAHRVSITGLGGGMSHNATVNQLLTDMDGLEHAGDKNIVVIGATNASVDELDPALMRPGRFDRKVYVGLPSLSDRKKITQFYLNKISYSKTKVDIERFTRMTVGNSPADIANIIREATLIAARKNKTEIDQSDLHEAQERIELGIKSQVVLSDPDKRIAAYHEAGHAMVTYLLVATQDVFKATIIPRGAAGGATWTVGKEERVIPDKEDLLGDIKMCLGGYAAEKMKFGITSVGVGQDLERANKIAENMVFRWGMGSSGPIQVTKSLSHVAEQDKEQLIESCLEEVNEVLRKEKDILEEIAQGLLEKEELDFDELDEIFKRHGKAVDRDRKLTYESQVLEQKKGVSWDDVIGMDEVKEEAMEIASLIKDHVLLKQVGGQIIRGLLLLGPPGCGKTYLASALANEIGIPFLSRSGSEFVEMYVGVGASRVRQLFREAREKALSKGGCIIFIDEFDALGSKRTPQASGGGREYNQTLNQLLVELDGLKEKDQQYNIVVIGATNMREKSLDPALLRPGRFDRKIYMEKPLLEDRKKLFQYYLSKVSYDEKEIDIEKFAKMTGGQTPADISNLIREAALLAVRNKKKKIGLLEIETARERIALGLKRRYTRTKEELRKTAYHEIGHVITNYFFAKKSFPFKVSIIGRRGSLGVAWWAYEGDTYSGDEEELRAWIKGLLGGYAAERFKFGKHETGISSDFGRALSIANDMVWRYGMGKTVIGDLYSEGDQYVVSDQMRATLEQEVQEILSQCAKDDTDLFKREQILFEHLTGELLKKQELNYNELESIFKKFAKSKLHKPSEEVD